MKIFEEGIFSDLRNLKPGVDTPKVCFSMISLFSYDTRRRAAPRRHATFGLRLAALTTSCVHLFLAFLLFGMSQVAERGGIKCVVQSLGHNAFIYNFFLLSKRREPSSPHPLGYPHKKTEITSIPVGSGFTPHCLCLKSDYVSFFSRFSFPPFLPLSLSLRIDGLIIKSFSF